MTTEELRALLGSIDGVRVLLEGEWRSAVEEALSNITLFGDDVMSRADEVGAVCLALGPDALVTRGAARKGQRRPAAWWLRDGALSFANGVALDPLAWVPVEPTEAGVRRAIAEASASDGPARSFRFFFGILPEFVEDFLDLENRLTLDPFCEGMPLVLGSAAPGDGRGDCFDDPLHVSQFETLRSRSKITVAALHQQAEDGSIAIGTIEYRPAPHAAVVRAWNEAKGSSWPEDLPLDVLGAIGMGLGASLGQIEQWIEAEEAPLPAGFATLVGFAIQTAPGPAQGEIDEVSTWLLTRSRSKDPDVRNVVAQLAAMAGLSDVLAKVTEAEEDPELRASFEELAATQGEG